MSGPNWSPQWLHETKMKPTVNRSLVVGGKEVEGWYRNFYEDAMALDAQRLLLDTVVGEYAQHDGVGMWNLGNEPDLFAVAPTQVMGQQWTREMVGRIKALDPVHPVTNGLHVASLGVPTAPRVDLIYAETDVAVMHGYPMYMPWVDDPLDSDFVPYMCALTTALSGVPTLMEEFGGCTAPPGEPSQQWAWTTYGGQHRTQFMAGEADFADYIGVVLPKLVKVGATGAMLWCYADYAPELWDKAPLVLSKHERHFGLVRPDGSLKPHVQVIKDFAATKPTFQAPQKPFKIDISVDEYYAEPMRHFMRLFSSFRETLQK
jgi:endo-1,4-beta-mannosidase